jgi:magnesium-protoporphyrin IX monomethyl ester (oxidative) cyclase
LNQQIAAIERGAQPKWVKVLRKLPLQLGIVGHLVKLYFLRPIDAQAAWGTVR